MENLEIYTELEYQRRHLIEQKTPEDRAMVMAGIDRLLDQIIDSGGVEFGPTATNLPSSEEGERHLAGQGTE